MRTKEKLLSLFEQYRGSYLSGEEIAARLTVSRTAVWKAVNSLRSEGYEIDAVKNKGYSLSADTDIISAQGVKKYLSPDLGELTIEVLAETGSTNELLKEKAQEGAGEGCIIIANAQTKGRGRLGRSFFSPEDTGVYMSLLLRPRDISPRKAVRFTTMAAVAACEAFESVSGEKAMIKWVNDVYMRGRKVSGILTEAAFGLENGSLDYVVLGIGINAYPPRGGFPKEIEEIAGAVLPYRQSDGKNRLAAGFINRFMNCYKADDYSYVERYRERSLAVGKEIRALSPQGERKALALDVDRECRLIVQYEDKTTEALSSGEISIRIKANAD